MAMVISSVVDAGWGAVPAAVELIAQPLVSRVVAGLQDVFPVTPESDGIGLVGGRTQTFRQGGYLLAMVLLGGITRWWIGTVVALIWRVCRAIVLWEHVLWWRCIVPARIDVWHVNWWTIIGWLAMLVSSILTIAALNAAVALIWAILA